MQQDLNIIGETALFKGFAGKEVLIAVNCLEGYVKEYAKKEVIFRSAEVLEAVGIILSGQVLLCKENISGMRQIFSELEAGDILGETALRATREPSGYEAVAGAACRILFIRIHKIVRPRGQVCQLRGRIIENMMALLLENNRSMYHKLHLVSHKSLRDRILHYLSLQAKKSNALAFDIPFSRSDLADYLNVDRSALSRELQRMAEDGLIRFAKNHFELLDADQGLAMIDF